MRTLSAVLLFMWALSNICLAEGSFTTVKTDRVKIEIPNNWEAQDLNTMKTLGAMEESRFGTKNPLPNLVYQSRPVPSGASVRVRFIETETATQSDLKSAYENQTAGLKADVISTGNEMYESITKSMSKTGLKIVSTVPAQLEKLNNMIAIVFSYERTSLNGDSNFRVRQYHVILGKEKCIITSSYRITQTMIWEPILNKVVNSIELFGIR